MCIVLITYTDLNRNSSLIGTSLIPINGAKKQVCFYLVSILPILTCLPIQGNDALSYLVNNKDVSAPNSRLHALSFQQIMKENNGDVDSLGPAFDPLAGRFVGPDGLSDAGDPADIALINSLASDNSQEADVMNSADAKFGVGSLDPARIYRTKGGKRHDMSLAETSIESRSETHLETIRRRRGSFKQDSTPVSDIEPQPLKSNFHILSRIPAPRGRSEGVPMQSRFSLVQHGGQMRIGQVIPSALFTLQSRGPTSLR